MITVEGKKILDACCGSRMMWFDKQHPDALYTDIRSGKFSAGYGDETVIIPDEVVDFRNMPYADESFYLVVMDPPHSKWLGTGPIMGQMYGQLLPTWETDIKAGFDECMRVLKPNGTLIFKWHEKDIKLSKLLSVLQVQPLFGHTSGKHGKTIWLTFMKSEEGGRG